MTREDPDNPLARGERGERSRGRRDPGMDRGLAAERRRERIRELIQSQRYVGVADLSERFGVSEVTVRADLERLQERGDIDRVRGGAIGTRTALEGTFAQQLGAAADEKEAIARVAVGMLEEAEAIFLDSGTTTTAVARELAANAERLDRMVVVTNSLPVALELEDAIPTVQVIVTGGTLRPRQHSLVEPLSGLMVDELHVDTTFLGCTGIDLAAGVTNINVPEATIKQRWHAKAGRTILVADGSKMGRTTLARVCPVEELDVVITGASADPDVVAQLRKSGVSVIVAGSDRP